MDDSAEGQPLRARRIDRRTVLKTTGMLAIGAAGIAFVGCGGNDDDEAQALRDQVAKLRADLAAAREGAAQETAAPAQAEAPAPAGAPVGPVAGPPRRRVAALADLREGEPVRFDYPLQGQTNVLIKLGRPAAGGVGPDGDIVAFSEFCTHMGCPIGNLYKPEHAILGPCACHFTTFDLTHRGMVVIGQATENLPQVVLEIDGGEIYAVDVHGIIYGFRDNLADASPVQGEA